MDRLARLETKLAATLAKINEKRRKLKKQLQVTRIRAAGMRRKAQTKSHRAVAALLAKADPKLYQQLADKASAPDGQKARKRKARAK
ncbi:MAG TPA: hypothetical protein VM074_04875 [Solimonas sp.]|nr:hypothetical protein [Solimonas sp.]